MNIGDLIHKDGKVFHVRDIRANVVEAIEDGVGDPSDLDFEPSAEHLTLFKLSDLVPDDSEAPTA